MKLPPYLVALNLSELSTDYEWDTVYFNTFWDATDEDNPRLADALLLISVKAAFGIGVACSEWVLARVEGHTDTIDAFLRIEAALAATVDPRYAKFPPPLTSLSSGLPQFESPLRLTVKLLSYAHERCAGDGYGVRSSTQGLCMLVDHITGHHPAFTPWLSESLRRCHEHFPASEAPVEEERPVPQELFEPGFVWSAEASEEALQRVVQTLDPAKNPYLCSPDEMLASGFKGLPYDRPS